MTDTKNIAIVFNGLYVGGAEKFGITLANKFAAVGCQVAVFIFKKVDSPLLSTLDKRVEVIYIHRTSKFNFILNKPFDLEIDKRKISKVIYIGLLTLFLTRAFSFKRNKAVSYFISLHSTIPASLKVYIQNRLFLSFARSRDKVLFICNNQRRFYNEKYYFKPKRSEVIYNGVDTEYYKPGSKPHAISLREAMNIPSEDKVVLLAATLRPEKGHAYAIESLKTLHRQHPDKRNTHLVFIGGGDERYVSQLKELAAKYSLQKFVHFEGSQPDVRKYYEIADIFTLTSFSVETFSLAALEAMCYGLPLSLTNIGGAAEMVFEGRNGLLTKPRDATSIAGSWAALLDACLDRQAIREIATQNFSLDMMFAKYQAALN